MVAWNAAMSTRRSVPAHHPPAVGQGGPHWPEMRIRLGGWAVAAVLVLSGCGVDGGPGHASPAERGGRTELTGSELVSARDTLPPAPPSATSLTVLLVHPGAATEPGFDAAAAALAERPDIRVLLAVAGEPVGTASTMSGFPVTVVDASAPDLVEQASAAAGIEPDLVVVGIVETATLGGPEPIAAGAAGAGVPALVVDAESGDQVDHGAAAMQLLEVLDLELDALLEEPAAVRRLTVPSCRAGTLRGRLDVRATTVPAPLAASDCTSSDRSVPGDEAAAVGTGHPALSRLP